MRGRFNITLSQSIDEELDGYAKEHDMTRSAVIESALKDFFKGPTNTQDIHIGQVNNEVLQLAERMKSVEETLTRLIEKPQDQSDINLGVTPIYQPILNDSTNSVAIIDHEKWYRHVEVVKMMPSSINVNTRKAKVSKAISKGDLITNNKRGNELLILGPSIEKWLNTLFHDMANK